MKMEHDRWTLAAEFDSVHDTITAGAYEGGIGEAASFYQWLREYWDNGDPDFLDEAISFEGETVTATCSMIDPFAEPLRWLLMHAVPRSVTLKRNVDRGW
jgi:hypothetical protein